MISNFGPWLIFPRKLYRFTSLDKRQFREVVRNRERSGALSGGFIRHFLKLLHSPLLTFAVNSLFFGYKLFSSDFNFCLKILKFLRPFFFHKNVSKIIQKF